MSQATAPGDKESDLRADHAPLLEVRLHGLSPLPPLVNGALVAAVLYLAYVLIAFNSGQSLLNTTATGVQINSGAWAAFVLSLVFATATTVPALGRGVWKASVDDIKSTLDAEGGRLAEAMAEGPPRRRLGRSLIAVAIGMVGGVAFNVWLMDNSDLTLAQFAQSTGLWFLIVQPVLFGLGVRAAVQLSDDDKDMARLVVGHLQVDMAGMERLQVYGRLALRSALSWLVMAAVILLFFVYSAPVAISIGSLVLSLVAGVYAFTTTIRPVVQVAGALRDAALLEVRTQIGEAGQQIVRDGKGGGALADLTAYEAWLEKRPVWPISAPITRRLALYGLIPILAWFGAAAAEIVLEGLAG